MADGDENTMHWQLMGIPGICGIAQTNTGYACFITKYVVKRFVPGNADVSIFAAFGEQFVLQYFLCTQLIPAMNQRNFRRNVGQI